MSHISPIVSYILPIVSDTPPTEPRMLARRERPLCGRDAGSPRLGTGRALETGLEQLE